jgi:hypothetical protein
VKDKDSHSYSKRGQFSWTIFTASTARERGEFSSKRTDGSSEDYKNENEGKDNFSPKSLSSLYISLD